MKIALVSTGLGNVWRGYERFVHELFYLLKKDLDITLFKGGGTANEREVVLPNFKRDGIIRKIPGICERYAHRSPYYLEVLSFYSFLLPHLTAERFDVVHFTDSPFSNLFYHTKMRLGFKFRFKTLFTNANFFVDESMNRVDSLHLLTPGHVKAAISFGISEEKIILIPFGVHGEKYQGLISKIVLKRKYAIPGNKKIVLAVSAINRLHKRINYLIREVASLEKDYFLLIAGHLEDCTLEAEAREKLGDRFKFLYVPFEHVHELYGLGDVFVMVSLMEGFGLALVEAMMAGLPVVAHDSDHFEWLVADKRSLTDLSREGNLARKIKEIEEDSSLISKMVQRNRENVIRMFDWNVLKDKYIDMYETVARGAPRAISSGV